MAVDGSGKQGEMPRGLMVVVKLGEWVLLVSGIWEFKTKHAELCKCVMLTSRLRFEELVGIVKEKFQISSSKSVKLSYRCPVWMVMDDGGTTPPASITSDDDVNVFEMICSHIEKVTLCVTVEGVDEGRGAGDEIGFCLERGAARSVSTVKGKVVSLEQGDEVSFGESDFDDGDWHNFALKDFDGEKDNFATEDPIPVSREAGECTHTWPCTLDLHDSGEDADMEEELVREKRRPCVLEKCADEALDSLFSNKGGDLRDAPPMVDESINAGVEGALYELEYEGDAVFIGRVFKTKEVFKVKMAIHAINQKFHFRTTRSTPTYVELLCFSTSCPWRVYASMIDESGNFQIKRANFEHSCSIDERRYFHRQATIDVIGELMRERFLGGRQGPRPCEIRKIMKREFEVNISYWKAWRCREVAMEKAVGSAKGSYALLPAYLSKLGAANPGSLITMEMENNNGAPCFKFLFLSFGASIEGWKYMRRVVLLDGTHLHGRYGGCMLTASAQDGNFQIFSIAYGVVDSENDKSWEWFFRCLCKVIPDSADLVFVSDRHGSIYSGLQKVYPLAGHGACVVHLARNIAARFKGKRLPALMALAARKFTAWEFNKVFAEIEAVDKNCAEYLKNLGFAHWTRSLFLGMRYNVMTTNIAEALNNVLKEGREFPIISMVESLRTSLMGWFARRRVAAASEKCAVTPKVRDKMETNFFFSTAMTVRAANPKEFQVQTRNGDIFIVDLERRMCSCREFQMMLIPCSHALAVASDVVVSTEKLVGDVYSTSVWRAAYGGTIHPVPTADDTLNVADRFELNPPVMRRPPGRPKKLRIMSRGEFKCKSKKGGRVCTRCLHRGHNKASCKMLIREHALGL